MLRQALKIGGLAFAVVTLTAASCSTSRLAPATTDGLGDVVGTSLIGAQGRTPADQGKIDETVAGLCGGGVYTRSQCARPGRESRAL